MSFKIEMKNSVKLETNLSDLEVTARRRRQTLGQTVTIFPSSSLCVYVTKHKHGLRFPLLKKKKGAPVLLLILADPLLFFWLVTLIGGSFTVVCGGTWPSAYI